MALALKGAKKGLCLSHAEIRDLQHFYAAASLAREETQKEHQLTSLHTQRRHLCKGAQQDPTYAQSQCLIDRRESSNSRLPRSGLVLSDTSKAFDVRGRPRFMKACDRAWA